ncbi:hypothetical protein MMC07_001525 [Pseudocyphellaria aurata]|nr:hypothetical protein [Pseudocyphellaria aurata]
MAAKETAWVSDHDGSFSAYSQLDSEDENFHESHEFSGVKGDDRELLREEEERENLLSTRRQDEGRSSVLGALSRSERQSRRKLRRSKKSKAREKARSDEKSELIFDMEEGGLKDDRSSQSSSSSIDLDRPKLEQPISKRRQIITYTSISTTIAALFCVLVFGAFKVSRPSSSRPTDSLLSNGSTGFAPTTILISLDGFRADFLRRGITPTLSSFIAEGVSPRYMVPSFPSVTFPNHYTLVTGLYPESHGVVGNTFWDPKLQEEFYYTDPARSMQPKWWLGGEPLWVTAEKQKVKTAIHMWPGSEAHIQLDPTFLDEFDGDEPLSKKVDRILELIDIPSAGSNLDTLQRPQLIAAYVPVVDADGHKYGPNSTEIHKTIAAVDTMLHDLFNGLDQRNLTKIVNIIVVSDHGMATTSVNRLIQLDDLIDLDLVEHIDGWPLYGLRPKNQSDLQGLYDTLLAESAQNPNFEVYLRDENMPERYHFSKNERIAPLWVIPKTGWAIVHKEDFDVKVAKSKGETYHPKGLHGYDHEHPLMRAIFVARGPAFPHQPNSKLEIFQNTEVYNIVCDSLGIKPKPNNGTLRLPLVPIGLHSDQSPTDDDIPTDLLSDPASTVPATPEMTASATSRMSTPTGQSESDSNEKEVEESQSLWDYLKATLDAAKSWAVSVFVPITTNTNSTDKSTDSN